MIEFRDELLEYLLVHSGEWIDIKFLTDKYCGDDNTFEENDKNKIKSRLQVNQILKELQRLEWLNVDPQFGIYVGYSFNNEIKKMQFGDIPVKARLTTKGEFEYRKSKRELKSETKANWGLILAVLAIIVAIIIYFLQQKK